MTELFSPALVLASTSEGKALGHELPLWSLLPFALLLLAIAMLPLVAGRWWHHNKNRALVSAVLAIPFAIWLWSGYGDAAGHALLEAGIDYAAFLALLGALFVISGGIYVKGSLAGTPLSNGVILSIGAVLANLIGTTGASMVLIRPLLRANKTRVAKVHVVVFFIFVVSNCGGLLTPLGDPPLYLGFLKGVPFEWTLSLWKEWVVVNGILILLFIVVDSFVLNREEEARPGSQLEEALVHEPVRIEGLHNVVLLCGVVLAILGKGQGWFTDGGHWPFGIQEGALVALSVLGYLLTKPSIRTANQFSFAPIVEVAVVFAGIFVTMVAPLQILNARGAELELHEPWQYFWATGALSSFLDNAPTYLAFTATAAGQAGISVENPRFLAEFLVRAPEDSWILTAISCGAVMMGAMTYIGNGPNFMVKAIAEESGVQMPTFFGYLGWSAVVLLPIFLVVTLIFFR